MPLEGPITDLSSLNPAWPVDFPDQHEITDDNLRKCKDAAKKSFLSMGNDGGVVTLTAAEFNAMQGVTGNVQAQLTDKLPQWSFYAGPSQTYQTVQGENLLVDVTTSGIWDVVLPSAPLDGTRIRVKDSEQTLNPGTGYVLQVVRQGTDTITFLNLQQTGAIAVTVSDHPASMFNFVYFSPVWYAWYLQ